MICPGDVEVFESTISMLIKIIRNIIKDPTNPKYRKLPLFKPALAQKVIIIIIII